MDGLDVQATVPAIRVVINILREKLLNMIGVFLALCGLTVGCSCFIVGGELVESKHTRFREWRFSRFVSVCSKGFPL